MAREGGRGPSVDDSPAFLDARKKAWAQMTGYGVAHELDFIDKLGTFWKPHGRTRKPSRRYLLEKYRDTIAGRRGFTDAEKQILAARVAVHLEREP